MTPQQTPDRMPRRALWNCIVGLAGLGYILMALFAEIESPLFAFAFVVTAIYEMWTSHAAHGKP